MDTTHSDLLKQPKDTRDVHDFVFLVEGKNNLQGQDPPIYRHEFLGLPSIPFLGKYGGVGYEFGRVLSLVSAYITFEKGEKGYRWAVANEKKETVQIPEDVGEILLNIPATIEENRREEFEPNEQQWKGKGKQGKNGYYDKNQDYRNKPNPPKKSQEDRKEQELTPLEKKGSENSKDGKKHNSNGKQPVFIATDKVKFSWVIQLNNIEVSQQLKKEPMLMVNYVMHTVLFPHLSFEKSRFMTARTPVGLIVPDEFKERNGVLEFIDPPKHQSKFYGGLKKNALRMEYSSVHLKGESLCFSPNNMRVVIDKKVPIGIFWVVALDETMQSNTCYLHWIVNEPKLFGPLENICKEASCIAEMFQKLEVLLGKNEVLAYTQRIFESKQEVVEEKKEKNNEHITAELS